jgi:predicted porin
MAVFNVSDYDARIYAFQNDVLYSYSIEAYQNKGFQIYINTRYTLRKGLDFWLRYESKRYTNLSSVGSGLSTIDGNHQSEVKIQLRYQF